MTTPARWTMYVSLLALLAPALGAADLSETGSAAPDARRVDKRQPATPDGAVRVDNATGTLRVVGWDKAEVALSGSLGEHTDAVRLESRGGRTEVTYVLDHDRHGEADVLLNVPAGSSLEVEGFSVETTVEGVRGDVRVESVNGGIDVAAAGGELDLSATNGAIQVSGSSKDVRAEAVNGAVTLKGVGGAVEASSVNGALRVEGGSLTRAKLETVSGGIVARCDLGAGARLDISSVSGDVELSLPASVSAEFQVSTMSGSVDNELGPAAKEGGRYMPHKSLSFTAGSGDAKVEIETLSGSIRLRKR